MGGGIASIHIVVGGGTWEIDFTKLNKTTIVSNQSRAGFEGSKISGRFF